ncbi:hypothetical protein ACFQ0K_09195 [Nocardioides caeni]|uniref:Uncharacterized protein n=1 Tax=Nocardioides caeni TaxID=574700 RepID=A0A4S8N085_9ACTN|nr:hypothetical protein [Nocardioides caeni]THV09168.1 hypothetical protein E9934_17200 [Nocardioides caeni]
MKRILGSMVATFAILFSTLLSVGVVGPTPVAEARCIPANDLYRIYTFKDKTTSYHPTNIQSDWATFRSGGTITYNKTKTATVSASVTATVSAEAGVIFAKASTSLGVTVGGSWSKSDSWAYSAVVPADSSHRYRLHMYHFSVSFKVMRKNWSYAKCNYVNAWGSWQTVKHAPTKANRNIWRLDKVSL